MPFSGATTSSAALKGLTAQRLPASVLMPCARGQPVQGFLRCHLTPFLFLYRTSSRVAEQHFVKNRNEDGLVIIMVILFPG